MKKKMEKNKATHEAELDLGFDYLNQILDTVRKTDWGQENEAAVCRKCGDILHYEGETLSICGACA